MSETATPKPGDETPETEPMKVGRVVLDPAGRKPKWIDYNFDEIREEARQELGAGLANSGPAIGFNGGAKVSALRPSYHLIEKGFLAALALVCAEGEEKYGEGNWNKGDRDFAIERSNHVFDHLLSWTGGDRSEPHLAKAAWGLMALMWFDERHPEWFQRDNPAPLKRSKPAPVPYGNWDNGQ